MFALHRSIRFARQISRKFSADSHGHGSHGGGSHGPHEPHVSAFFTSLGKGCLIGCYLWIFYRFKQDPSIPQKPMT